MSLISITARAKETFAPGLRVLPYVLIFNDQEELGVLLCITILQITLFFFGPYSCESILSFLLEVWRGCQAQGSLNVKLLR